MGASQSNVESSDTNHLKNYIECLPDDAILEIGKNLSHEQIMNFSNSCSRMDKLLSANKNFWRQKLLLDREHLFPNPKIVSELQNPRENYVIYNDIIMLDSQLNGAKKSKPRNVTFSYFTRKTLNEYPYFKAITFSASQAHFVFVDQKYDMWIMDTNNFDSIHKYNLNKKVIAVAATNNLITFIDEHSHVYAVSANPVTTGFNSQMRLSEYKFKAITAGLNFVAMIDVCNNLWVTDEFARRLSESLVTRHDPMKIPGLKVKWISAGYLSLMMIDINDDIWFFSTERQQTGFNVPVIYKNNISEYPRKIENLKAKRCSCFLNIMAIIDLDDNVWTNVHANTLHQEKLNGHKALYVWVTVCTVIIIDTEYNVWMIDFASSLDNIVLGPSLISGIKAHDVISSNGFNGNFMFFRQSY
jgi:hypothetical protein